MPTWFSPAGGAINELLPGWRTLIYARAIENLVFTVACRTSTVRKRGRIGTIAGPEGLLAQEKGEGLILAELDLDRLSFLRQGKMKRSNSEAIRDHCRAAALEEV